MFIPHTLMSSISIPKSQIQQSSKSNTHEKEKVHWNFFRRSVSGWWMEQPAKALASRSGRQTPTAAKVFPAVVGHQKSLLIAVGLSHNFKRGNYFIHSQKNNQ